jgi:hypothetical protein
MGPPVVASRHDGRPVGLELVRAAGMALGLEPTDVVLIAVPSGVILAALGALMYGTKKRAVRRDR